MFNRSLPLLGAVLMMVVLSGCSWFKEKPPEYLYAEEVEPLRVPTDLDAPIARAPLTISAPEMRRPSGDELNPGPPRAVSTAGRGDANAWMAWSAQGVYLSVLDSPGSVTRRLGFAIERTGMRPLPDDGQGGQRFEYVHIRYDERSFWQKMAFWNDGKGPDFSGVYRARIVPDGENSRVYLELDSGRQAPTNAAEHVLEIFMERLG